MMAPASELPELAGFLDEVDSEDPQREQRSKAVSPFRVSRKVVGACAAVAVLAVVALNRGWSSASPATRSGNVDEAIEEFGFPLGKPGKPHPDEKHVEKHAEDEDMHRGPPSKPGFPHPPLPKGPPQLKGNANRGDNPLFMSPKERHEANRKKMIENLKIVATLTRSKLLYDEDTARAFASMAKISYCGPLPGIYAAVASSCSRLNIPGAESVCEAGNFSVVPGFVRTVRSEDEDANNAIFGIVAKVRSDGDNSKVKDGVLISMRGSIDNYQNSVRDKQTSLETELPGCEGCHVHQGYYETYLKLEDKLKRHLRELGCAAGKDKETGEECKIYVTGHGSGAAVASLVAWELTGMNYTVGPSYIFESPKIGDAALAAAFTERFDGSRDQQGPIFSITYGKDSVPRWPYSNEFKAWGVEAYYESAESTKHQQICMAGDRFCGIGKIKQSDLSSKDTCQSPLAPDGNFCTFTAFSGQCYGGLGFNIIEHLYAMKADREAEREAKQADRDVKKGGKPGKDESAEEKSDGDAKGVSIPGLAGWQPNDQMAASWHPSDKNGEQARAVKHAKQAKDWYNLDTLNAMASLSKVAYCGPTLAVPNVVQSTCNGYSGPCSKAGFGVVPRTVVPKGVEYQPEKTNPYYNKDTLFFYTALIRRTDNKFAKAPHFVPAESCVLVFRGSANQQNMEMNTQTEQVGLNDTDCGDCTASKGILEAWDAVLEEQVLDALRSSGCEAKDDRVTSNKVFIAGHSLGGTLTTLAAYKLHKQGFDVQLSWALEAGRPGNPALMDYINHRMLASTRPVPLWQISSTNDYVARTPRSTYAKDPQGVGRHQFQVHFAEKAEEPTLCTTKEDMDRDSSCGIYAFDRADLSDRDLPNEAHCKLPYLPGDGNMCMLAGYPVGSPYAQAIQCAFGGSIA